MPNGQQSQQPDETGFPLGDVKPTTKERIMRGVGGFLSGGSGRDFKGTPLDDALNAAHQKRLYEAQLHWKNYTTYTALSHLKVGSTNPQTGQPITEDDVAQWKAWAESAYGLFEKSAGVDKETKARIKQGKQKVDAVAGTIASQADKGQGGMTPPPTAGAAGGEQPAAGGLTPPPSKPYAEGMAEAPAARSALAAGEAAQAKAYGTSVEVEQRKRFADDVQLDKDSLAYKQYVLTGKVPPQAHFQKAVYINPNDPSHTPQDGSYDPDTGQYLDQNQKPVPGALPATASMLKPKEIHYLSPDGKPLFGFMMGMKLYDQEGNELPPGTEFFTRGMLPTETLRQVITYDAQGNPQINTLETLHEPIIGGKPVGPSKGGGAGKAGKPAPATPEAPKGRGGLAAPPQPQGAPRATDAAGRPLGMSAGMATNIRKAVTPVREAITQVAGDPTNPALKSLSDFATIADDKAAQTRLGKAFELTFNEMDIQMQKSGGLWELIQAEGGVPAELATVTAQTRNQAIAELASEQERDYYNAAIASFSGVVGARASTGASAAQFSIKALERDLPLIGVNTTNQRQYYDKLIHVGEIIHNAYRGLPRDAIPPEERAFLDGRMKDWATKRDAGGRGGMKEPPKAGGKAGLSKEAADYLRKQGIAVPASP